MTWRPHPLLCLYRAHGEPLRRFLTEILVQEGYLAVDSADLDDLGDVSETMEGRALVMVSASSLTPRETEAIAGRVRRGHRVVLIRPPDGLIEAIADEVAERPHRVYGLAPPGYARLTEHAAARHHQGLSIQIHAATPLWRIAGEKPLAYVAANTSEASTYPAVTEVACGSGRAVIFHFDLGAAMVLTRQGDPRRATTSGWPRDDQAVVKPGTLFLGHLDPELREVPQADVLADLLVGVIRHLTDDVLPIARVWPMPKDSPALTLLDGDSDVYDWDAYGKLVEPCVERGIPYTLNLMPAHLEKLDRRTADAWMARGNDFQLHYFLGSSAPTVADMARCVPEQQRIFRQAMGGRPSVGSRGHSVLWPGYTETAEILAEHGACMETNFMPFRGCQYGYVGSGRAARFMTLDGRLLSVSQQPTVFMDDPMSNEKSLLPPRTPDAAYQIMTRLYGESASRYHGVVCTCLHPAGARARQHLRDVQAAMRQAVIDATERHSLVALNMRDWCAFQEARRQVKLWHDGDAWRAEAGTAMDGVTFHLPSERGVQRQGHVWRAVQADLSAGESILLAVT